MTQLLEQAIEQLRKLSTSEQDAIAALILEEIAEEQRWDQAFARRNAEDSQPNHGSHGSHGWE